MNTSIIRTLQIVPSVHRFRYIYNHVHAIHTYTHIHTHFIYVLSLVDSYNECIYMYEVTAVQMEMLYHVLFLRSFLQSHFLSFVPPPCPSHRETQPAFDILTSNHILETDKLQNEVWLVYFALALTIKHVPGRRAHFGQKLVVSSLVN